MAEEARITKQAMMALVDDLAARGYVRRVADPSDTRAKLVRLTARGRTAAAQCRRSVLAVDQRTRRRLGDRTYDTLVDVLGELADPADEDE
jgi:DNA-binding MarR family transcriptional regulator